MSSEKYFKLRNGVEIPKIGFGTNRFGHREKITDERFLNSNFESNES